MRLLPDMASEMDYEQKPFLGDGNRISEDSSHTRNSTHRSKIWLGLLVSMVLNIVLLSTVFFLALRNNTAAASPYC